MMAVSKTMADEIAMASLLLKWNSPMVIGTTTMPPPTPATLAIPSKRGRKIVGKISEFNKGNSSGISRRNLRPGIWARLPKGQKKIRRTGTSGTDYTTSLLRVTLIF